MYKDTLITVTSNLLEQVEVLLPQLLKKEDSYPKNFESKIKYIEKVTETILNKLKDSHNPIKYYAIIWNRNKAVIYSSGMLGLKYVCLFPENVAHGVAKFEGYKKYKLMEEKEFHEKYPKTLVQFCNSVEEWKAL